MENGFTALLVAAEAGHLQVLEFLLSAGANVSHVTADGMPALYIASQNGHLEVVKLLLVNGADIHQATAHGLNSLHIATSNGHNDVADYLMKKGAEFEVRGTYSKACKWCCGASDVRTKLCNQCMTAFYCSAECQMKDWKEGGEKSHKVQCARLKEQKALYKERKVKEVEEKLAEFGVGSRNQARVEEGERVYCFIGKERPNIEFFSGKQFWCMGGFNQNIFFFC